MSSFAEVLQQLASGQVYDELGGTLTEAVLAVQETRKAGQITLVLKIKPNGEHGVMIADTVTAKIPQRPRGDTLFFVTAGGNLMRNDPRQEQLPLRQVLPAPSGQPLRQVFEVSEAEVVNA